MGIGQGKWIGIQSKPETFRLFHKTSDLCDYKKQQNEEQAERAFQSGFGKNKLDTSDKSI